MVPQQPVNLTMPPRHDRAVRQVAAGLHHHGRGTEEQRGPARVGRRRHQHVAPAHTPTVVRRLQHACCAGSRAGAAATPGHDVAVASVAGSGSCTGPTARPAATEGAASVTTPGGVYRRWSARRRFRSSTSLAAPLPFHIPSRNASMSTNPRWNTSSGVARCPAPAKGRRHVPNNMGQCPISIQVFFPDAPRSCEGMDSPCVQAEARVRMPLTRRPGPRSVPARCRRRATRGQRLQRFCAAVGAGPARAPRPRPRGRPPERARRTPVPSHTARRRWSSELRP